MTVSNDKVQWSKNGVLNFRDVQYGRHIDTDNIRTLIQY